MTGDGDAPKASPTHLAPVCRFWWQTRQWSHPSLWRKLPALLCALASILSLLALNACASTVPPSGPCHWTGEAAPPVTRYQLGVIPLVAADGVVYVGYPGPGSDQYSAKTIIAALRERDGALLWSVPDSNSVLDSNNTDRLAYADGVLLLLGHGIVGLRASDGATLWSDHAYGGLPWAIGGDVLYVNHEGLYAFRISDGRLLWQTPTQVDIALSTPVVDGATVYVGSSTGFLMALQADTGALLWKIFPSDPEPATPSAGRTYTPIGVVAGQVYVLGEGVGGYSLLRVNPADGESAPYTLSLPATTPLLDPLIVNGTLYVGVEETPKSVTLGRPDIVAYRLLANGGKLLWRLPANGSYLDVIAHDARTFYLQDLVFGGISAVRLADGVVLWRQIRQPFGRPADADETTGEFFETVPGIGDSCNPSVDQAPQIGAFKRADGSVIWTRALDGAV